MDLKYKHDYLHVFFFCFHTSFLTLQKCLTHSKSLLGVVCYFSSVGVGLILGFVLLNCPLSAQSYRGDHLTIQLSFISFLLLMGLKSRVGNFFPPLEMVGSTITSTISLFHCQRQILINLMEMVTYTTLHD